MKPSVSIFRYAFAASYAVFLISTSTAQIPDNVLVNNPAADTTPQDTQCGTAIVLGNGNAVIVAYNDSGSYSTTSNHFIGWSHSNNGGASFVDLGKLPNSAPGDAGYMNLARNTQNGNIYLTALPFTGSNLNVFRSTDNGLTFLTPPTQITAGAPDVSSIAVDNFPGSGQGTVYVAWRDFSTVSGLRLAKSIDNALTFQPAITVESAGTGNKQGPTVAIGPDHSVYVAYLDEALPKTIKIRKSTTLGATFTPAVTVGNVSAPAVNGNLGLGFATNAFPKLAVNPVSGNLYVVYPDVGTSGDRCNIYFTQSTDGGATWSPRVRVNNDTTTNDQFQPVLAVTPDGTRVFVGFYDRRRDPANNLIDVYGMVADSSGSAVIPGANFRITTAAFPPAYGQDPVINPTFMGHYDNATADNSFFYYPWGDNRLGNAFHTNQPDVRMAKIPVQGVLVGELVLDGHTLTGGTDGLLNPNECNFLNVSLRNNGTTPVNGISATVVSNTPGLTVLQASSAYPNVGVGGSATGLQPFRISTSSAFPCFRGGSVTVNVTSNQGNFSFPLAIAGGTDGTIAGTHTFNVSSSVPIPDSNFVVSPLTASGITQPIMKATVSVHATHTFMGDLRLELVSPEGTTVSLIRNRGGSGDNMGTACSPQSSRTTFDDSAATAISAGTAPFTGTFRPETPLDILNGMPASVANGNWQLIVRDTAGADTGTLMCWSLHLITGSCTQGTGPCQCNFNFSTTAFNFSGVGGSATLGVTANCDWTPGTSDPWIVIDSYNASNVAFHVTANPSPAPRSGNILVDGQAVPVQQSGSCSYAFSPLGALIPSVGGTGNATLNTGAACPWTASVTQPWVTLSAGSGSGTGVIGYTVEANLSTQAREAFIQAQGQTYHIIQWGDGPDLTGAWTVSPLVCKTKSTGLACTTKSYFAINNIGTQDAEKFRVNFYLSPDGTLTNAALLKSQKIKRIRAGSGLAKKASLKLPPGTGPGMVLIGVIDAEQLVPESNRINNTFISAPLAN